VMAAPADAVRAEIAARLGENAFRDYGDGNYIDRARDDLARAKRLFEVLDRVPSRRDREAAYSALSHIIYGTFAVAQSGIYPDVEMRRSFDRHAANIRSRRPNIAARDALMRAVVDGDKSPRKQLLEKVNARLRDAGEKEVSRTTLDRVCPRRGI